MEAVATKPAVGTTEQSYLNGTALIQQLELAPGMVVGDFGVGGSAFLALPAARAVTEDGLVLMFDILKTAISAALSMAKVQGSTNCKGVWSNLELYGGASGVKNDSLDAGIAVNLFHQSKKYKDMLAEIHRMLKPGAKLLVVDWNTEVETPLAPPVERRLSPGRIEQAAQSLGYTKLKQFEASQYHWGLILAKT